MSETIEEKTYRIMIDLHKNTGSFPTLEESLKDSIFLTVRDAVELAIAEEREACIDLAGTWAAKFADVDFNTPSIESYIESRRILNKKDN